MEEAGGDLPPPASSKIRWQRQMPKIIHGSLDMEKIIWRYFIDNIPFAHFEFLDRKQKFYSYVFTFLRGRVVKVYRQLFPS